MTFVPTSNKKDSFCILIKFEDSLFKRSRSPGNLGSLTTRIGSLNSLLKTKNIKWLDALNPGVINRQDKETSENPQTQFLLGSINQ